MRYRWKLLLLLLALALGPMAVMRPFGLHAIQNLGQTLVSQTQESLLKQTEDRLHLIVEGYSEMLRLTRTHALISLEMQAQEVERLLGQSPAERRALFIAGRPQTGAPQPELIPSDRHVKRGRAGHLRPLPVSYRMPVFKLPAGADDARLDIDCQRLAGMADFWRTVVKPEHSQALWRFVTLDNGVHLAFPGHNSFPPHLDPRARFNAANLPLGEVSWLAPYVDPATRQVVTAALRPLRGPTGATVGVTGMVLPLSQVLERPFLAANMPAGTVPLLCHLETGGHLPQRRLRIVARESESGPQHRRWWTPIEPEWISGDDAGRFTDLLDDIEAGRANMRRMGWQGADSLWTYGTADPKTVLLLITPYDTVHRLTAAADREARVQVARIARSTLVVLSVVCGVAVLLAIWFAKTVTKPLKRLSEGAQKLAAGDFNARVAVGSRDEFGQMAQIFNQVGPELQAHYDLRRSLDLAREVQQNLLPAVQPQVAGLDAFGQSHYCDQTGGDYFDYLAVGPPDRPRLVVIVGDVAGHGISSALLMATARALIRQRMSRGGDLGEKLADVNALLCEDVGDSGQFMTLAVADICPASGTLTWVRAGHEPGIRYDPAKDRFAPVEGRGLPLGVNPGAGFEEERLALGSEEILLLGTDGIWETLDPHGEMFGKRRLEAVVRAHSHRDARGLVAAVMDALDAFRQDAAVVDDATLVVVKRRGVEPE